MCVNRVVFLEQPLWSLDFGSKSLRKREREIKAKLEELTSQLGREPTDEELIKALGYKPVEEDPEEKAIKQDLREKNSQGHRGFRAKREVGSTAHLL